MNNAELLPGKILSFSFHLNLNTNIIRKYLIHVVLIVEQLVKN